MKYCWLLLMLMLISCVSSTHVRPVKPLMIQPISTPIADPVVVVPDEVNVQAPVDVFVWMVVIVALVCVSCGLLPWITSKVKRIRMKNQIAQSTSRVVLND